MRSLRPEKSSAITRQKNMSGGVEIKNVRNPRVDPLAVICTLIAIRLRWEKADVVDQNTGLGSFEGQ